MTNGVDYYSVLGVPRDVSPDELRRRYRQLVRQHHPDVADDKEAAQDRLVAIVEAYRTLSDPARRRAYDALQATTPPPIASRSVQIQRQIDDWFRHAVHRLEQGDRNGAAAQCRKILALDTRHAAAHALLGDIHMARDEWDQALICYSSAVANAPRSPVYARKLRSAAEEGQRSRSAAERLTRAAEQRRRALDALNARHEFVPYLTLIALAWLLLLAGWGLASPGEPPVRWFPLPLNLAVAAAAAGAVMGLVLTLNGLPRRREGAVSPEPPSVWLGLSAISLVQFYLGVTAYLVLSVVRERLTPSLNLAYAAAVGVVACLVLVVTLLHEGWGLPTALWSGNLVLPGILLGSAVARFGLRLAD